MIKQLLLPLLGVAAFIIIVGLLVQNSGNIVIPGFTFQATPSSSLSKTNITVGGKTLSVEVANTEPERELGLGGRNLLPKNSGMLFIFDAKGISPGFWMKGMLFPLDIIWIGGGKIIKIDKNISAPSPGTPDSNLVVYNPGVPIDYVLEVNAGYSDLNGLKTGSLVDLSNAVK